MSASVLNSVLSIWVLVMVVLFGSTLAGPIGAGRREETPSIVVASEEEAPTPDQSCQVELKKQIEDCLMPFEQLLVTYQRPGITIQQQYSMVAKMCLEYTKTLNCLHLLFQQCAPGEQHLQLIEYRIATAQMQTFLKDTCSDPPKQIPSEPTTVATESTSATTTTTTTEPTTSLWLLDLLRSTSPEFDLHDYNSESQTVSNARRESGVSSGTTGGLDKSQHGIHDTKISDMSAGRGLETDSAASSTEIQSDMSGQKNYIHFEIEQLGKHSAQQETSEPLRHVDCSDLRNKEMENCQTQEMTNTSPIISCSQSVTLLLAMSVALANLC